MIFPVSYAKLGKVCFFIHFSKFTALDFTLIRSLGQHFLYQMKEKFLDSKTGLIRLVPGKTILCSLGGRLVKEVEFWVKIQIYQAGCILPNRMWLRLSVSNTVLVAYMVAI